MEPGDQPVRLDGKAAERGGTSTLRLELLEGMYPGGSVTLDEAVEAVRRTLPPDQRLRVDRKLARQDDTAYLLIVLDARRQFDDGDVPIENGPRLVTKANGIVSRLTVPEAVTRAADMALVP